MCCCQVIIFTTGATLVGPELLGITIACLHCLNMLSGSFFHIVISRITASWGGVISSDSVRHYSLESYQSSLIIIPVCYLLGIVIIGLMQVQVI